MSSDVQRLDVQRPALWNPNAAGLWSILLTPAFGAYLHAANWRTLGKPERASANIVWVWGTVAFMLLGVVTNFLPDSKLVEAVVRGGSIGLLVGWYYAEGKRQTQYVNATFPDGYTKRGWGRPLAVGVTFFLLYLVVAFLVVLAVEIFRSTYV